jgi:hypothetical protein
MAQIGYGDDRTRVDTRLERRIVPILETRRTTDRIPSQIPLQTNFQQIREIHGFPIDRLDVLHNLLQIPFEMLTSRDVRHAPVNRPRSLDTHWLTPFLPSRDMAVREISGRIHARSRRCSGKRIQSSQNLFHSEELIDTHHSVALRDRPTSFDFVPNRSRQ